MSKSMNELSKEIHTLAKEKGWWEQDRNVGELIALMHSELSEALEEWRHGHEVAELYWNGEKPEGIPVELADCIIRILDLCAAYEVDIDSIIELKMLYNQTRQYRHGGLRA